MLRRSLFTALKQWQHKQNRKPLLVKGVRQVGKTFLLQHFGKTCFKSCHSINFENDTHLHHIFERNLDPARIITELSFELEQDIDLQNDLLIFDEIQACPPALTSLKYFNEETPELAIAAAGSLLGVHMSQGSFPVGKVDHLQLQPLNFIELLHALEQEQLLDLLDQHNYQHALPETAHQKLLALWRLYMVTGGMPEVIQQYILQQDHPVQAMHEVRIKQHELISAYNSDIAKHAGKVNAMHIARVWEYAAIQLASNQHQGAERFRFKDVVPGIDRYQRLAGAIDWLDTADLIIKIPVAHSVQLPLKAYSKESLFKIFYHDVGLLGARCDLPTNLILDNNYGGFKGYMAENFVAQALLSDDAHNMMQLFSWQEQKAEVEFLQTSELGIIPIEVKAGNNTKAKSLEKLCQKYQPTLAVILSANNIAQDKSRQLYQYPLYLASLKPWLTMT